MRIRLDLLLIILVSLSLFGCENSKPEKKSNQELTKVSLQLKWQHSAQFAGFYLAKEKGYYTDEGLEVVLIEGGPSIDQAAQLSSGQVPFALIPAESLFLKNEQRLMKAIGVVYQRSPLIFAVKKDSAITNPHDFAGKTIAVGDMTEGGFLEGIIQFKALTKRLGIDTSSMTFVPYDWSFKGFIDGSIDVTPTYLTSGYIKLKHLGIETDYIWPGDYDLEFYADTLVVQTKFLEENPDIVSRLLRASVRGWQEAITNPDVAVESTLHYTKDDSRDKQEDMMNAQAPLINTGLAPILSMNHQAWQEMHDRLVDQGVLATPISDIESLYDVAFINSINPSGDQ